MNFKKIGKFFLFLIPIAVIEYVLYSRFGIEIAMSGFIFFMFICVLHSTIMAAKSTSIDSSQLKVEVDDDQIVHITYNHYQASIPYQDLEVMSILPQNESELSNDERRTLCFYVKRHYSSLSIPRDFTLISLSDISHYYSNLLPCDSMQKDEYLKTFIKHTILDLIGWVILLLIFFIIIIILFMHEAEGYDSLITIIGFFGIFFFAIFYSAHYKIKQEKNALQISDLFYREVDLYTKYTSSYRTNSNKRVQTYMIRIWDREKRFVTEPIQVLKRVYTQSKKTRRLYFMVQNNQTKNVKLF